MQQMLIDCRKALWHLGVLFDFREDLQNVGDFSVGCEDRDTHILLGLDWLESIFKLLEMRVDLGFSRQVNAVDVTVINHSLLYIEIWHQI